MSIKYLDSLNIVIYLKKEILDNNNFKEKEEIEKYLKKLFKILNNKYEINIEGFYNIDIYIDKFYGVVLHLEKEDFDYFDYFKNQVDMKITVINTSFLYEVDDIPYDILDKFNVIVKNNNIYLEIKEELSVLEKMILLENSKLIYDL